MKQRFIKLFMLLTAFAFILSATAQHQVNLPDGRTLSSIVKKEAPAEWGNSTKDVIFYEDFSDGGFDNWTIVGEGAENWVASETNQAGGVAPEAMMYYSPVFLGTSRFVSPVINTTGYTELALSFLHVLDLWSGGGGFWVSVETTSDGGTTWNQVWELEWTTTDDYYAFEVLGVSTPDVGSDNFQMCFKFEDNSDLLDYWLLDNITLGDPIQYDVTPTDIIGLDDFIFEDNEVYVSADINNYGSETVSFDVVLEISDGSSIVFESTKSVSDLAFGEVATVDFDMWTAGLEGTNYSATVTTQLSGDENPDNDQMVMGFIVFPGDSYCIPTANCDYGDGFTDFAWAGIENFGSGCSAGGYGVFTDLEASVEIGYSYTATFATGYGNQMVSMWIDFNQDYEFTDIERVLTDYNLAEAGVLYNVDIVIPGNGLPGTTTMRIGANWIDPSSPDPCATFTYGEWEDYSVEVTGTPIDLNAGVVSIDIDPLMPSGDITPLATVKNYGVETISFPVTMTVAGTGYSSTVQVTDLGLGDEVQVEFETWNAPTGAYEVEVCTELSGDQIPDNDCMTAEVSTIGYDAGVAAINIGSIIMAGDIIPKATVKNYGFETISFPVTMTIEDADYTSTVEVSDLAAGEELLVEFDTWTNYIGQHAVEVCTELLNDENAENDCSDMLVTVSEDARQKLVIEFFTGTW